MPIIDKGNRKNMNTEELKTFIFLSKVKKLRNLLVRGCANEVLFLCLEIMKNNPL